MSAGEFVPPSAEALNALIPDCTVESLLAQGGMGAIYRGLQTKLDRPVAIKILPKSHGADLDYANRFEQEAKAMAKLSHNNIVGVYDYGETSDGTMLYFIMEFIEGSDLYHRLRDKDVSYSSALPLIRQICDALQYAHANGIVHRDIKPANILIDNTGVVKMADFGLAKMQRAGADDPDGSESGTAFGTPDYIAPEALIEGIEVDHRADIYSLGVVIYEILTGQVPKGTFDLPSTLNPEVDRRLDDLIVKAMSHDRDLRYSEVEELKKVITAVEKTPRLVAGGGAGATARVAVLTTHTSRVGGIPVAGAGVPRSLPPARSSNTSAILAVLILLVLAAGGALYLFVFKPGVDAHNQVAGSKDASGPKAFAPGTEKPGENSGPTSPTSAGNPQGIPTKPENSSSEPEVFTPTPEPITPIPYAGKLRAFGTLRGGTDLDLSTAEGIDDVVSVEVRDSFWHALRANGETLSSSPGQSGITGIRWSDARKINYHAVRSDGTVWISKTNQVLPDLLTDIVMCMGRASHNSALRSDGTLVVWGKWYGDDDLSVGEPPRPFTGIVDIAALGDVSVAVDRAGKVHLWGPDMQVITREPQSDGDAVVDVEPAGGDFIALTKSGHVFSWHTSNLLEPHQNRIAIETGYFIKVRGGNAVRAAQRADGTWLAWGHPKWGVIDKINSLPPTPDIAMLVYENFGCVLWIEPNPAYMPGAEYTSTAKPGSEVLFFSETIDMSAGSSTDPPSASTTALVPDVDPSTLTGTDRIIAELRQKVISRHREMVQKPYLASLAELNDKYVPALERTAAAAVEKGDTFTAKAVSDDIAKAGKIIEASAADDSAPVLVSDAADPSGIPADVQNLRGTYRREHKKIAEQRDANARAVLNTYITDLELLESQLESSRGAAEAASVKSAIEAARSAGVELFQ